MFLFLFLFFSMLLITMCIFQIKRIISSEKWFNYVVTFFMKMTRIWVGRTTLNEEKKEDDLKAKKNIPRFVLTSNMRQWCHLVIHSSLFHSGNHSSSGVL